MQHMFVTDSIPPHLHLQEIPYPLFCCQIQCPFYVCDKFNAPLYIIYCMGVVGEFGFQPQQIPSPLLVVDNFNILLLELATNLLPLYIQNSILNKVDEKFNTPWRFSTNSMPPSPSISIPHPWAINNIHSQSMNHYYNFILIACFKNYVLTYF